MNDSFKKGFEKTASIGHLLAMFGLPSLEKRIAKKQFEHSKRKAMGLPVEKNKLLDTFDEHITKHDNMKPGLKKKVLNFFMDEGPGVVVYTPSRQGKNLGTTLKKLTESVPFGLADNDSTKEFLSKMTHPDPKVSAEAMEDLTRKVDNLKGKAKVVGMGALGSLGAYLAYQMANKKGQPEAAHIPQELHSSSSL